MRVTAYFCGPRQIRVDEPVAEVSLIGDSKVKKRMAKKATLKAKAKLTRHPKRKATARQGQSLHPAGYAAEAHPEL
jgi:hypothetical protein